AELVRPTGSRVADGAVPECGAVGPKSAGAFEGVAGAVQARTALLGRPTTRRRGSKEVEEVALALIKVFAPAGAGNRGRVHGEVECGYTAFETGGKTYLQLDTYGSNERAIPGKVSQSIQLDEEAATQLKHLLEQTFPGI